MTFSPLQKQLKNLLSGNGYEVDTATDFSNVIEQVKAFAPHLVLLDIKLPGNSGFEICSQIRSFSDIPIVFVTSSNTDMDELNSIMLGGDAFITKPYNTAILLAKIASLLRRAYTEKDYSVREIRLSDVVHGAIADSKYLLRQNNVAITVDDMEYSIYSDDKWVRFILDQIISNVIKYRTGHPILHLFAVKENERVVLSVEDNGIGIPQSDLPRIFEKGFTGQNGRTIHSSTGIGLYLCKRLCDKLGIGIAARSEGKGTIISLSFHINDFVTGVQG